MKAEEARKKTLKVVEQEQKAYEEIMKNQILRLIKLINESAEGGNCHIDLHYEPIQPDTRKWLLDNGYRLADKSTEENYFFTISW